MKTPTRTLPLRRVSLAAAWCIAAQSGAQTAPAQELLITSPGPQQVSGLGDIPLSQTPVSGVNIDARTLRDLGAGRISDALRLDASVSDSYNSPAYWDVLSVRGFTLDNRYNYRREGLPISAETTVPMDNKERIELFKGTSGIQAGTSAPGGLANYVVKRAPSGPNDTIRSVSASYGNGKNSGLALDLGARMGEHKDWGYRFNAAYEDLNPYIRNARGHRHLLALAMDWRISADSRLEWEFEHSERQQIGINGYSVLAPADNIYGMPSLPAVPDVKLNMSAQPWSVPAVFLGNTGSVRYRQHLGQDWVWTTQYGRQRLRTDDRLAFAFGVGCRFPNYTLCDRFIAGPQFDIYDYRSENERRLTDAFQTSLSGQLQLAGLQHQLTFSVLRSRQLDRLQPTQLYSYAGTSTAYGGTVPIQTLNASNPSTNRSEYSTELSVTDRVALSASTAAWLGLRHTRSDRSTVSLDAANPNPVSQQTAFTTPWLALSHTNRQGTMLYASYGESVELFAAPNIPSYMNAGQFLGVQRSQQVELGAKGMSGQHLSWNAALFRIERPLAYDFQLSRVVDGLQTHQGLDVGMQWRHQQWALGAQAQWIDAQISGARLNQALNGNPPVNVPTITLRTQAQYRWAELPGLRSLLRLNHEGSRRVLEEANLRLPAWTTLDFATHYETIVQGVKTEWTFAIDNLTDKRYWRESPKTFGHYYLFPGAPRTGRIMVRAHF